MRKPTAKVPKEEISCSLGSLLGKNKRLIVPIRCPYNAYSYQTRLLHSKVVMTVFMNSDFLNMLFQLVYGSVFNELTNGISKGPYSTALSALIEYSTATTQDTSEAVLCPPRNNFGSHTEKTLPCTNSISALFERIAIPISTEIKCKNYQIKQFFITIIISTDTNSVVTSRCNTYQVR
ncbi:hypothetical protein NHE_0740 [Neorickettsia helminthoeca str. Oregon]|uniref:Uncharacterized protein n=1 Tax=Neorickettsia helminthoeca str. Oregon TaxID=1286528 RepID=X5GX91_9RICK|nr:hypothetical protein NHE_0740 [Neorickettsia helminthoeca str. Oregon]